MEQLCYLQLIRDLVLPASLAVPLTLFTLVRTKKFITLAVGLHGTVCILLQIAVLFALLKKWTHVNERRIRAVFCRFINLPGTV